MLSFWAAVTGDTWEHCPELQWCIRASY